MINYDAPFPQADDFNKIISLLNIEDPSRLKDNEYIGVVMGEVSDRQISYYLAACNFLGIVNKRQFTETGNYLRGLSENAQVIELSKIVFSHPAFSTLFLSELVYEYEFSKQEVVQILKKYTKLDTEAMYERRASTVSSWVRWFKSKLKVLADSSTH